MVMGVIIELKEIIKKLKLLLKKQKFSDDKKCLELSLKIINNLEKEYKQKHSNL